jgi:hypothetical protein
MVKMTSFGARHLWAEYTRLDTQPYPFLPFPFLRPEVCGPRLQASGKERERERRGIRLLASGTERERERWRWFLLVGQNSF